VTFRVDIMPAAARALRRVEPSRRPRVEGAIRLLAEDPRPPASRKVRGRGGYRVRVGDYRMLYLIEDGVLVVVLVTINHRHEVYER
jgi:mRNA interferase RelE/StbE